MRALTLMMVFFAGCGTPTTVGPDENKLGEFSEFTVWGTGMEGHNAPTSAGGDGDADADGDADGGPADDTGGSSDPPPSGDTGACMNPDWDDCLDTDEATCDSMGWLFYGDYSCEDFMGGAK